jgi:hypothetical protein
MLSTETTQRQVLIAGVGSLARITQNELRSNPRPADVVGFLRFEGETPDGRLHAPILGSAEDIERVLTERFVDEVYFATFHREEAIQSAIRVCERLETPFAIPASEYRFGRARPTCTKALRDGYLHFLFETNEPARLWLKRFIDTVFQGRARHPFPRRYP